MVHRAPAVREPSPLRRFSYRLAALAVSGGVAASVYALAQLCVYGHVTW